MTGYVLHDEVVQYLIHCLGVHETPDGSNRGPVQVTTPLGGVDLFEDADWVAGHGYPWCISTIQAAWKHVGHPLPWLTAGAYDLGDRARAAGWAVPVERCIPGDPIIFRVGAGHGATLERYDASARVVHTLDGNTSNRVKRNERPVSLVHTAIHVPEKHAVPPAPAPFWVIATSENGHRQVLFTQFATEARILKMVLPPLVARYGKAGLTITRGGVRKKG